MASEADRLTHWVRDHAGAVRGFLVAMVRDRDAAEDLLQEVFCRAWEARGRYTEAGKERAYLLRIADRLARDRHRRAGREIGLEHQRWARIEPEDPDAAPLEILGRAETERQLAEALRGLSEPQRRTLLLRFYGNLAFREIAQILDCPLSTALSHCRRGLEALRRMLVEEV